MTKGTMLSECRGPDADPKLGRKMIAGLAMRLHQLMNDVESYSLHSGRRRIICYLLREEGETGDQVITVTLPTNKGVIASRLNLTQEHFSRILHELSEKKPDRRRRAKKSTSPTSMNYATMISEICRTYNNLTRRPH
ncbi:hypothetical protein E4Q23_01900 [Candidatus Accumulibacter phosphatis]|uniref:HTH crp-type domain-containing protein n=1 Tax=Candidatus Accumulibacter phosphatis TaxID=327160 RepID=A0ABX1TQW8_9PROT|nr:hypothetical protein [Candidatus Accumulibacter phosphatis]